MILCKSVYKFFLVFRRIIVICVETTYRPAPLRRTVIEHVPRYERKTLVFGLRVPITWT